MLWDSSVDGTVPSKRQELDGNADVVPARNTVVMGPIEKDMGEEWHGCSLRGVSRAQDSCTGALVIVGRHMF